MFADVRWVCFLPPKKIVFSILKPDSFLRINCIRAEHERDCHSRANEQDGTGQNGTTTKIGRMRKFLSMTVQELQTRIGVTVHNSHE
jgi:hypothetical protein